MKLGHRPGIWLVPNLIPCQLSELYFNVNISQSQGPCENNVFFPRPPATAGAASYTGQEHIANSCLNSPIGLKHNQILGWPCSEMASHPKPVFPLVSYLYYSRLRSLPEHGYSLQPFLPGLAVQSRYSARGGGSRQIDGLRDGIVHPLL